MHARAEATASIHQLASVIAMSAPDHNHHIALSRQLDGGGLALLRRPANCVNEAYLGARKAALEKTYQAANTIDRLCRLSRYSKPGPFTKRIHVVFCENYVKFIEIPRQTAHFHVVALAYDD